MSKNKIKIKAFEEENSTNDHIPLEVLKANNDLNTVNEELDKSRQQLLLATDEIKKANMLMTNILEQVPPLMEKFDLAIKAANYGFNVKVPEKAQREFKAAATAIVDDMITRINTEAKNVVDNMVKRMKTVSQDFVDNMTHHYKCIPIRQGIFWGLIAFVLDLFGFFVSILAWNFKLQDAHIWQVIGGFLIAMFILGLLLYFIFRK